MAMTGVDVVIHLAAVADVKDVANEPVYSETESMCAGRSTARNKPPSKHQAVYLCRHDVGLYGATVDARVDEKTRCYPDHLYTATKIASEYYCQT